MTVLENSNFALTQTVMGYSVINNITGYRLTNKTLSFNHANQLYKALLFMSVDIVNDLNVDATIDKAIQQMRKRKNASEMQLFNICCDLFD